MHKHIARPEKVKPLVLKGKCFDVTLHKGHPVAHPLPHSSGPSLLDVELGQVQAHDRTAKALGQRTPEHQSPHLRFAQMSKGP